MDETDNYDSSNDTEDDMETIETIMTIDAMNCRRIKIFDIRKHPMNEYLDDEFRKRFRFTKSSVMYIINLIHSDVQFEELRNDPIAAEDQILMTLRYYATGSFQIVLGDLMGVSQSTAHRIIYRVTHAIGKHFQNFIKMPNLAEQIVQKRKFYNKYINEKIPNVIGKNNKQYIIIIYG